MRNRVVFPAPLGPSNPAIPGPNEQLTSETATFWPNHFDTAVTSTVGAETWAGLGVALTAPSGTFGTSDIRRLWPPER